MHLYEARLELCQYHNRLHSQTHYLLRHRLVEMVVRGLSAVLVVAPQKVVVEAEAAQQYLVAAFEVRRVEGMVLCCFVCRRLEESQEEARWAVARVRLDEAE